MFLEKIPTFENRTGEMDTIQPKETSSLREILGENEYKYEMNYTEMNKIIKEYYKKQGRIVTIQFNNYIDDDRFPDTINTIITLSEESEILGVKKSAKTNITHRQLEDIIASALKLEGKQLVRLENNATTSSRWEGYCMDEHEVKYVTSKTFTIVVKG